MSARAVIVLLCVLVAISEGARMPSCRYASNMCPMNYSPVCGTNGVTYGNECVMCAAIRTSKMRILIHAEGECQGVEQEQQVQSA